MRSVVFFSCLVTTSFSAPNWLDTIFGYQDPFSNPTDDYNGYEQAPYTVIQQYQGFESRTYPGKYWACTSSSVELAPREEAEAESDWSVFGVINFVTRDRSEDKQSSMFWKLFRYISGDNIRQQKIEMTVPVMTNVKEIEQGKLGKRMCFYLPEKFQSDPPKPLNPDVTLMFLGHEDVLVKTFGGYIMQDSLWMQHAQLFRNEIETNNIDGYDLTQFISVGYDSPMTLWDRRNEIIFEKK